MSPLVRNLGTLAGALVVYFAFPTERLPSGWSAALSVLGLIAGGSVLAVLIIGQLRRTLRPGADDAVRIQTLFTLLYLSVLVFALGYYMLERSAGDQFVGLETKIDALYFTVVMAATVGFGDVHPTGQVARAIVTGQIVFNLVFLGLLVSMMSNQLRRRADAVRGSSPPPPTARR